MRWQQTGIDGVRLRPAVNATDLPVIVDEVVPLLQQAGCFRTGYTDGETLRERLGLPDRRQPICEGPLMNVPLSILDLAPISEGCDAATALRNTVDLAQHAEQWGYRRYWVAEHHFVAVASSSPAVLIGQIAAATERIRVGAAAVQLGHTTAVAVVESFGMLDAFHPGRIDLGVGRSGQRRREAIKDGEAKPKKPKPPTEWRDVDGVIVPPPFDMSALMRNPRLRAQMSVLQQPEAVSPDFAEQVADILAMLDGSYRIDGVDAHAVPGEGAGLTPWVFGSSKGQSAQVAAALRPAVRRELPHHPGHRARRDRRLSHRVSAVGRACANHTSWCLPTWWWPTTPLPRGISRPATATGCTRSAQATAPSRTRTPTRVDPLTDEQLEVVKDRTATQFVGDADEVAAKLETLQRVTEADELVVTSVTHRHADRLRIHELLAKRWGQ